MICPSCHRELINPERFCEYCGTKLEPEESENVNEETGKLNGNIQFEEGSEENKVQEDQNEKIEQPKRKKQKETRKWLPIATAIAVAMLAVIAILIVFLFVYERNISWIVSLSELESTQKSDDNGTMSTYQLNSKFERMSVKATSLQFMRRSTVATSSQKEGEKLLQIWIDDTLVYEIEAGQSEKEYWTFAIDLRGINTMRIFTANEIVLDDVQVIRQSAQKEIDDSKNTNGSLKDTSKEK